MNEAIQTLLLQADSATEWECPPNFDYLAELERVRAFSSDISQTCAIKFVLDDQVQDASFFADLYDNKSETGIRFSAFGRLALTFIGNIRYFTSNGFPDSVIDILQHHNYIVVRPEDVDGVYDGLKKELYGETSWFGRLFDYL